MAHRMCLHYAKDRYASIQITHKPLKGDHKETVIPYFYTRDLHPPKGFREETITLEIFASADYDIIDKDIMTALTAINLDVKGKIHRPSMGKECCPVTSNKRIVCVVPPGHTSKEGGKWTLIDAANMFEWPRHLRVQMVFDDGGPQPALIYLRYNIYGDGSNNELTLCKICHKKDGHANDCENGKKTVDTMDDYTRKLKSMSKTNNKEADKPCKWYLFGLCQFQTQCKLLIHDKGVPPSMIGCALPKTNKNKLIKMGLPKDAMICKGGGHERCMYNHQEWGQELNSQMHKSTADDPNILGYLMVGSGQEDENVKERSPLKYPFRRTLMLTLCPITD